MIESLYQIISSIKLVPLKKFFLSMQIPILRELFNSNSKYQNNNSFYITTRGIIPSSCLSIPFTLCDTKCSVIAVAAGQ